MTFTTRDFFLDDTAACFIAHVPGSAGMKIVKLTMKPCQNLSNDRPGRRCFMLRCAI